MEIGEIYNFDKNAEKVRIIGLDEIEVFYEPWFEYGEKWYFAGARNVKFFRISRKLFEEKTIKIDNGYISAKEVEYFRPDLPLRINRIKKLSWQEKKFETKIEFGKYLENNEIDINSLKGLDVDEIYLEPVGASGGRGKGVFIKSVDGENISGIEILYNAFNIQAEHVRKKSEGIGIYRSGIKNKIPAFYLGSYYDLAGIIEKNEE